MVTRESAKLFVFWDCLFVLLEMKSDDMIWAFCFSYMGLLVLDFDNKNEKNCSHFLATKWILMRWFCIWCFLD